MANEINIALGQVGLSVTARLYLDGVLDPTIVSCDEVAGADGLYMGDMPAVGAGVYQVMFYAESVLRGSGSIDWTGDAEALISTRLAASAYLAPDNAGITTLVGRLTAARAALLDNLTPLNDGVATLLARLTELRANYLDRLNGTAVVTVNAPLDARTFALSLKKGDSYTDELDRAIVFEDDGQWPDLSTADIAFDVGNPLAANLLSIEAELLVGSPVRVKVELTAAQTQGLTVSHAIYWYDLRATIGNDVFTLCTGAIRVLRAVE